MDLRFADGSVRSDSPRRVEAPSEVVKAVESQTRAVGAAGMGQAGAPTRCRSLPARAIPAMPWRSRLAASPWLACGSWEMERLDLRGATGDSQPEEGDCTNMTPRNEACSGTRGIIGRWRAVAFALVLAACGMRSGLFVSSPDGSTSGGSPGGEAGAGGIAADGSGGYALPGAGGITASGSGGHASPGAGGFTANGSGGRTSPDAGTVIGQGGVSTGGSHASTPALGGSTTVGRGGSAGNSNGGNGNGGRGSGGLGTGGRSGTGGNTTTSRDGAVDTDAFVHADAAMPGAPTIDPNSGYATVHAGTVIMSGYVASSAGGSGSSIGLTCTANSFCASGTVGASPTYNSWANAGFNVNQPQSGGSGSTGSLALVGSTISISYVNHAGSRVELELWDNISGNFWCYYLPPSTSPTTTTVPLSSLNTKCWDNTGMAFTSGTSITMVQLAVGGSATTPTPFDYCFLGLTVQ